MVLLFCFAVLGALVAYWLSTSLSDPLGAVGVFHELGHDTVAGLLEAVPGPAPVLTLTAVLAGTLLPGLVCLLLAESLAAGVRLRRVAGVTLLLGAGFGFTVLDPVPATVLFAGAVVTCLLLWLSSQLLMAPVAFVLGYVASGYALSIFTGTDRTLEGYGAELGALVGFADWWPPLLALLALAPVAGAFLRLLRS